MHSLALRAGNTPAPPCAQSDVPANTTTGWSPMGSLSRILMIGLEFVVVELEKRRIDLRRRLKGS
jgi:hypothetical protein